MKLLIILLALTAVMSVSGMNSNCRCECPQSNNYEIAALNALEEEDNSPYVRQHQYEDKRFYRYDRNGRRIDRYPHNVVN